MKGRPAMALAMMAALAAEGGMTARVPAESKPRELTDEDRAALARAEEKRRRKAEKLRRRQA